MASVEEAQDILAALGLPAAQRNEISAYTLIALLGLKPQDPWSAATRVRCGEDVMVTVGEAGTEH